MPRSFVEVRNISGTQRKGVLLSERRSMKGNSMLARCWAVSNCSQGFANWSTVQRNLRFYNRPDQRRDQKLLGELLDTCRPVDAAVMFDMHW
jgi:hypothetical protein